MMKVHTWLRWSAFWTWDPLVRALLSMRLLQEFPGGGGIHDERAEDFQIRVGQQRAEGLGACAAANATLAGH